MSETANAGHHARMGVGTTIEFHVASRSEQGDSARYTAVKARNGAWKCFSHGDVLAVAAAGTFSSEELARYFRTGSWVVESVGKICSGVEVETIKTGTIQPDMVMTKHQSFAKRAQSLNKRGVTITLRNDGWTIFEANWCRLEISPEQEDFDLVLAAAEATFGKD